MMKTKEPSKTGTLKVLRGAKKLIQNGGWIRHLAKQGDSYCLMGAINHAHGKKGDRMPKDLNAANAVKIVAETLPRHSRRHPEQSLISFNDIEAKSKKNIIDKLNEAIRRINK